MKEFNKIIIVSLCDKHAKKVGKMLSDKLGVIFCDAKELIEYQLIDRKAMEDLCSTQYLQNRERGVVRQISSFENVAVVISYDYFFHNKDILNENSLVIFLKYSKSFAKNNTDAINQVAFQNRSKTLEELADLTILIKKTDEEFVCNKIIQQIGGMI